MNAATRLGTAEHLGVSSAAEGTQLLAVVTALIDQLSEVVERETALVRDGRLRDAAAMESAKTELSSRYLAASRRVRASASFLKAHVPALLQELQELHGRLRELLQANQMVLATAHAVAEGLIRGAAGELGRKRAPQTYGAAGRAMEPPLRSAQPVILSRTF